MDLQSATETIYESGVAGDLTDEPAMVLLQWGEAQLPLLMEKHGTDEAAFEAEFETLRRIMKGVNRIVARASDYSGEQLQNRMGKVVEWAQEIGLPAEPDALPTYIEGFSEMDEMGQVSGIVAILSPPVATDATQPVAGEALPATATEVKALPATEEEPATSNEEPVSDDADDESAE